MNSKMALLGKALLLVAMMAMGATLASASSLSFSCDPTIDATQAGTCAYLNSTISDLYTSALTNVNASIYIQMGTTSLGSSTTGSYNDVAFSTYLADFTATASTDTIDVDALAALNSVDNPLYGSDNVVITSALGEALGIPDASLVGTTAGGSPSSLGPPAATTALLRSQPRRTSLPRPAVRRACTGTKPEVRSLPTTTISTAWWKAKPTKFSGPDRVLPQRRIHCPTPVLPLGLALPRRPTCSAIRHRETSSLTVRPAPHPALIFPTTVAPRMVRMGRTTTRSTMAKTTLISRRIASTFRTPRVAWART